MGSFAGKNFNDPGGIAFFHSSATNLDPDTVPSGNDVYSSTLQLAPPSLNSKTGLEAPPDLTLKNKTLTVAMQQFGSASLKKASSASVNTKSTYSIRYQVSVQNTASKQRYLLISKRNTVSRRNLSVGIYTAQYRVLTVKSSSEKVVSKTAYSPKQRVQIT